MQPPKDTQRLPAYSDPERQDAATEQLPTAQSVRGQSVRGQGVTDQGAAGQDSGRRGGRRTGRMIVIGAVVAVVLLLAGAIGLEAGMRKSIGDRLTQEVTASLGSPAQVDLGARPVLLSMFTDTLGSVHITTDGTPAEGQTGPLPVIDITAEGVRESGDLVHVDSLHGTAFVSDETMVLAAQGEAGGMLGGLVQVQEIVSDPEAGTLRVSISGLAEAVVTPRLTAGQLELDPEQASVFGFELPPTLLGGTLSMMDSALAELPDGVELTGVHVVPGGMTIDLSGQDVVLESTA